ncbi:MAG: D-glycero-beta-D-manno-heptose 1,7-bisphosphate 7-phosphatase [Armatimonadota bacterium]|nr:D-glycero-beta-D-manno-heptose 1,7-bisphosphate 7-phosphatase [Armatimonadota bacterium]
MTTSSIGAPPTGCAGLALCLASFLRGHQGCFLSCRYVRIDAHVDSWQRAAHIFAKQHFYAGRNGLKEERRRPALFLDRDGVINADPVQFVTRPEDLRLLPDSARAIARFNALGIPVVVCSNQSGVAKGLYTLETLERISERLQQLLGEHGAHIDAFYYCPHDDADGCDCRKPKPGLLLRAAEEHNLALERSVFVGDSWRDIQAGRAAGVKTVLVLSGHVKREMLGSAEMDEHPPDHIASDLNEATEWILHQLDRCKQHPSTE